jgi:hypothetical protein
MQERVAKLKNVQTYSLDHLTIQRPLTPCMKGAVVEAMKIPQKEVEVEWYG